MKLKQLTTEKQSNFIETLFRYSYPVYCTTAVQDFDYHFIGSGFLLRWENRLFFMFTRHQAILAAGGTVFFVYKGSENGIRVDQGRVLEFEHSDLVISELQYDGSLSKLQCVELPFLKQPDSTKEMEFVVVGYQTEVNSLAYEKKIIQPRPGGVITELIKVGNGTESIELDLSAVSLCAIPQIQSFKELTQGLSGSPVFGFRFHSTTESTAKIEFHFIGITTHVAEATRKLYLTRTYEIISCLNAGFGVFTESSTNS